jgi:hypothetical protein
MVAAHRESAAAHARTHPGAGDDAIIAKSKVEKEQWNKFSAWLMDERRVEKLRALVEERDRRLKAITQSDVVDVDDDGDKPRKRRVTASFPPFNYVNTQHTVQKVEGDSSERGGIFKVTTRSTPPREPKTPNNSVKTPMATYIRPALSTPYRPSSPRRTERRRNGIFNVAGDFSPRPRGRNYTPPRLLPNGDETAPFGSPSPAPSRHKFDFVSPLGPVKLGTLTDADEDTIMQPKNSLGSSLEAVQEEGEEEGSWTVVTHRRQKRAGSAPVDKAEKSVVPPNSSDDLVLV